MRLLIFAVSTSHVYLDITRIPLGPQSSTRPKQLDRVQRRHRPNCRTSGILYESPPLTTAMVLFIFAANDPSRSANINTTSTEAGHGGKARSSQCPISPGKSLVITLAIRSIFVFQGDARDWIRNSG